MEYMKWVFKSGGGGVQESLETNLETTAEKRIWCDAINWAVSRVITKPFSETAASSVLRQMSLPHRPCVINGRK